MSAIRLDKIICDTTGASRSEARRLIKEGSVKVSGKTILSPSERIENGKEDVELCGSMLGPWGEKYYMLNKPAGLLSATEDREQKTVLDLFPPELCARGLFHVGRLDKDTTGLLIITSDGQYCHAVTSPKHCISKCYETYVNGVLTKEDANVFESGITLRDGTICLPARLDIDEADKSHGYVTIFEGKYHQVKRMLASIGKPVISLKRLSIGALELDKNLVEGQFREMTREEVDSVFG